MKKILLGLWTLSLAILPVSAMLSCSEKVSKDYQIIAIPKEREVIGRVARTIILELEKLKKPEITQPEKDVIHATLVTELNNLFNGVNNTNIVNISIVANTEPGSESVGLSPINGFTINGKTDQILSKVASLVK